MKKGFSWIWVIVGVFIVLLLVLGYFTYVFYPRGNKGSTENPSEFKIVDFVALCKEEKGKVCKSTQACNGDKEMLPGNFECCLGTCDLPTENQKICKVSISDNSACTADCDICICSTGNSRIYRSDKWDEVRAGFTCLLNFAYKEPWWFPAQLYKKVCATGQVSGFCKCGSYACGSDKDKNFYCEKNICKYKASATPSATPTDNSYGGNNFYNWPTYDVGEYGTYDWGTNYIWPSYNNNYPVYTPSNYYDPGSYNTNTDWTVYDSYTPGPTPTPVYVLPTVSREPYVSAKPTPTQLPPTRQ